jgi:serine/threonine protein kinase/tetratricopeptide (TPR) repeat protein
MPVSWTRTKQLFSDALQLEPTARAVFLSETCGDDTALRAEVESLLESHDRADSFLESAGAALWHPAPGGNMIGQCVGDYRIVREAGRGGSSIVYLAERADQLYEKCVAIKMLRSVDESTEILQRFRMERQTLAKLDHPNIVTLLDGGTTIDGMPYLVMDFIEGVPVDQYCDERALSIAERLKIFRAVCDTVEYAHYNGVIHRDLKPSNILVTNDGVPRLLDFGIAKLRDPKRFALSTLVTQSGMHAMTPEYASPEQVRGHPVTAATDIYSLGVLLYVLLCGHHPYRTTGRSLLDWERAVCEEEPMRPSVAAARREDSPAEASESPQLPTPQSVAAARDDRPTGLCRTLRGDLDAIAMNALNKEPERRYPSAREFSDDIGRYLTGMSVTARRTTLTYRSVKFLARHRESLAVAAIAVATVGIVAAWEMQRLRAARTDRAPVAATVPSRPAVAILGFKNLSGREDTVWLGTALAEMLATELAEGERVRLVPGETIARARIELALPDVATLSADTLKVVRQRLGSDLVVSGSYLDLGATAAGHVRLDLRLQDAVLAVALPSVSVEGEEQQLLDLVSRSGARLRERLGLPTMLPAESISVQGSLPSNTEAARLYSLGLTKLRSFDALAARDLLSQAENADPGYPMAHAALAQAWLALGYDAKGRQEAKTALDTAGRLNRENYLLVEGGYYEASKEWPKAIDAYRTLFNFFPDNPEYGLALANAQTKSGQGKDAMISLQRLRRLPREADFDPRVDLATVNAASVLSDNTLQANAAVSAVRKGRLTGAKLLVAAARVQQCRALANVGDVANSGPACEEARAIYQAAGDWAGTARVLHTMAEVPLNRGELESAQTLYEEALAIARRVGDQRGIARELGNLGVVFAARGQLAQAETYHQDSLAVYREIGYQVGVGGEEGNLGEILRARGRLREAMAQYQDSLARAHDLGNAELEALDLNDIGDVFVDQGNLAEAARQYDQSLKIFRDIGEKGYQAATLVAVGRVKAEQGDTAAARALYEQALAMQTPLGVKGDLAQTQLAMAELLCETNEAPDAAGLLHTALQEFQIEKRGSDEIRAQAILARVFLLQHQIAPARAAIDAAAALVDRGSLIDRLEWQLDDARVRWAETDTSGAERAVQQALVEATNHGLMGMQFEASLVLGEIQMAGRDQARARTGLVRLQEKARNKGFGLIARKAAALAARPVASATTT